MTGSQRPITQLLDGLGRGIAEHITTLERALASGRLASGAPINEVARRKMGTLAQELRELIAWESGSANRFPALRSLKDFENNFERLADIGDLHDHLRTICFAWAMQKHPEWIDQLRDVDMEILAWMILSSSGSSSIISPIRRYSRIISHTVAVLGSSAG